MKIVLLTLCIGLLFFEQGQATNYYVRKDGNDANTGLANTPQGAWKSVNTALYGYGNYGNGPGGSGIPMLPGDTLFVGDGLYQEDGYGYGLKIDGIAGSSTAHFVMKSINKWGARLELTSLFNAFNIQNSTGITIDGFDIFSPDGSTNIHSGIFMTNSEFVTIKNCKLHNFGLGAIGGGANVIIENNIVYDNSIRNPGNGSGINIYHPVKKSNNTLAGGWGFIIRDNTVYNNYCNQYYTPVGSTKISPPTDGNGIIIDDWNFTQDAAGTPYKVPCLIENNVCFNNGGSGIRVYDSDNVTIRNNTCYHNNWVTALYDSGSPDYPSADISATAETGKGNNIAIVNNIAAINPALPATHSGIGIGDKITNGVVRNNYTDKLFFTVGPQPTPNVIGNTVQFVNAATDPATANFRLMSTSPAINIGLNTNAPATDFDGTARPSAGIVDAGAYEYQCLSSEGGCALPAEMVSFVVKNEGTRHTLTWQTASERDNAGFDVERSGDGRLFERIGFVRGNGTTLTAQRYAFVDVIPSGLFRVVYYRLTQKDTDGRSAYSKIISLVLSDPTGQYPPLLTVYPNPSTDNIVVHLPTAAQEIALYSVGGRLVFRQAVAGDTHFHLAMSAWPAGLYTIRVHTNAGVVYTARAIKN